MATSPVAHAWRLALFEADWSIKGPLSRRRQDRAPAIFAGLEASVPFPKRLGSPPEFGSLVLELARSGADLAGVVSFHGGLSTSMPAAPGAVKASVLVLNGADDKGTAGDIAGFEKEMNAAGVDWQFVNFGGAVHCFALPHANQPGCAYNERAAKRSERIMRGFLAERFAAGR